ncbi:RHS repeat domain-containing protein [Mesoterricola silvestris]|uniref:RHS repeat domain-containing protein n=1 Tax=Mesoterricola silvestris TaxID=2927979 RepID=UPI00292E2E65|nr:RHS repeat-associated core domain-containing protein [Mesoterricola silvestris]
MSTSINLLFITLALVGMPGVLRAQSFQSSFSEVKFDRAKGPATLNAGVQVDVASGAASMEIPFGPGIGQRGLTFRPTLSLRIAPQVAVSSIFETYVAQVSSRGTLYYNTTTVDTIYQRGYGTSSFSPGSFDLALGSTDETQSAYRLPGGGGTLVGTVPPSMTAAAAGQLLAQFGVSGSLGTLAGDVGYPAAPFIQVGSTGALILGILDAAGDVQDWHYQESIDTNAIQCRWPRRILVVEGDVAYEFTYVSHRFRTQLRPYLVNTSRTSLFSANYALTHIRNRFGERVDFTYAPDGIGYTATWSTNPSVRIQVAVEGSVGAPGMPSLVSSAYGMGALTRVRVSYQGISHPVSSFLLDLGCPKPMEALTLETGGEPDSAVTKQLHGQRKMNVVWGEAAHCLQPVKVQQTDTGESVQFAYAVAGTGATWDGVTVSPTVLRSVTLPNRIVTLDWKPYTYQANSSPNAWGIAPSSQRRPSWAFGVSGLTDADLISGSERATGYTRVVPQLNWLTAVPPVGTDLTESWVSTAFYTAVTTPDGQVAVHRFVEPDPANGMQFLAYLKHVERETRYYAAGVGWEADLPTPDPGASSAYKWVVKDRLSVHAPGNARGVLTDYPVPYATRTRTWDKDAQTFTAEETTNWEASGLGWTQVHRTTALSASPSLGFDVWNLASQGAGWSSPGAASGTEDLVVRTLDSRIPQWLLGRVATETTSRGTDATQNGSTANPPPKVARERDGALNTLRSVTTGDPASLAVVTTLDYQGASGLAAAEMLKATLSSPNGLAFSGSMGVAAYGYDGNGYLSSIGVRPNAGLLLTSGQDQDEVGRPTAQRDADNRTTTFEWDGAGRLTRITPPGMQATEIAYDDVSHRGLTVTRGAQVQALRYNGYGELVLERRLDPNGGWSHRIHGYDGAGRPTGETVWLSGDGADHETQWMLPNLTRQTTVTVPGESVCKKWGAINPDTGERACLQWQTSPPTTTVTAALYRGSSLTYDSRGRADTSIDPAGLTTVTAYPASAGFKKVVTVAGTRTTQFLHDAAGRLKAVTDALGQVAAYGYDASNRLVSVSQSSGSHSQARSWTYNALGWLTSLEQPESGTTTYSGFTVAGRPQVTDYNGRSVTATPDGLGRVLSVVSSDGTVNQSFTYDTAPGGRGKPAWSQDGQIQATYGYDGTTGRLSTLTTLAAGQSLTQTLGYDAYGNRTSGSTGHADWTQSYFEAAGLPRLLSSGGQTIADSSDWSTSFEPVSWLPRAVAYGNGASSHFSYGPDQMRLGTLEHFGAGNAALERWGYAYDPAGNLAQVLDLRTLETDVFGYDALNRLVSATLQSPSYGPQSQTFTYDAFGNRISGATTSPGTVCPSTAYVSFDPNDAALWGHNRLPVQMANGAYTGAQYDAQGNLTQVFERPGESGKVITLGYDALGRVTSVEHSSRGVQERYQYRADGLRTVIQDYLGGTYQKSRIQLYNDARQLVSQWEVSPSGSLTWTRDVFYVGTQGTAERDSAGLHVTQVDHLGSPRVVTGPAGTVESRQKYLPFGELLEQSGTFRTAKGFTGHEQTDASGLIYMQARFYLPQYGRFASPDPARDQHFEFTQSWNINSYVQNNPVMSTDPTGLQEVPKDPREVTEEASVIPTKREDSGFGDMTMRNKENRKASKAEKPAGWITIHSSTRGEAGITAGHSYIEITTAEGEHHTYGTWGNTSGGGNLGLREDFELKMTPTGEATRTQEMNGDQLRAVLGLVQAAKEKGRDAWSLGNPCSTFAHAAWEAGTGEDLKFTKGGVSNPTSLKEGIIAANGGVAHGGLSKIPADQNRTHRAPMSPFLNSLGPALSSVF